MVRSGALNTLWIYRHTWKARRLKIGPLMDAYRCITAKTKLPFSRKYLNSDNYCSHLKPHIRGQIWSHGWSTIILGRTPRWGASRGLPQSSLKARTTFLYSYIPIPQRCRLSTYFLQLLNAFTRIDRECWPRTLQLPCQCSNSESKLARQCCLSNVIGYCLLLLPRTEENQGWLGHFDRLECQAPSTRQ